MNDCRKIVELETRIVELEKKYIQLEQQFDNLISAPLTQKKAADYLHISRHTLRRHTEMGLLSAIPGTTKYRVSELERYKAIHGKKR